MSEIKTDLLRQSLKKASKTSSDSNDLEQTVFEILGLVEEKLVGEIDPSQQKATETELYKIICSSTDSAD